MLFKEKEICTIYDSALIINNAKIQSLWQSLNKLRRIKNYRGSQCIYTWKDVKNKGASNYVI